MSVYPMFGVSYFCVPIFMSSYLHVTHKMGWHRCLVLKDVLLVDSFPQLLKETLHFDQQVSHQ